MFPTRPGNGLSEAGVQKSAVSNHLVIKTRKTHSNSYVNVTAFLESQG